jgi:hypothetical protein
MIAFADHNERVTVEKAIVRWVDGQNFGVRLIVMQPGQWARLVRVMGKLLEAR